MREKRRTLPKAIGSVESLDDRVLLSAAGVAHAAHAPVAVHAVHVSPKLARIAAAKAAHVAAMASARAHPVAHAAAAVRPAAASIRVNPAPVVATTPAALRSPVLSPSVVTIPAPRSIPAIVAPTSPATNVGDIQNGPLAKAGQFLTTLYQEFQQGGGGDNFHSSLSSVLRISGTSVEVNVRATPGQFPSLVSSLAGLGMQVVSSDPGHDSVAGYLPIGNLLNAAQLSQVASISPVNIPRLTL